MSKRFSLCGKARRNKRDEYPFKDEGGFCDRRDGPGRGMDTHGAHARGRDEYEHNALHAPHLAQGIVLQPLAAHIRRIHPDQDHFGANAYRYSRLLHYKDQ